MPFNLGGPEMIIILAVVLIVFGAGKLPNTMRDLGRGVREFKKAQSELDDAASSPQSAAPPAGDLTASLPAAPHRPAEPAPRA